MKPNQKKVQRNVSTFLRDMGAWLRQLDTWQNCLIFMNSQKSSNSNLNPQFLYYFKGSLDSACLSHMICLNDMYGQLDLKWQNLQKRYCISYRDLSANDIWETSAYHFMVWIFSQKSLKYLNVSGELVSRDFLKKNFFVSIYFKFGFVYRRRTQKESNKHQWLHTCRPFSNRRNVSTYKGHLDMRIGQKAIIFRIPVTKNSRRVILDQLKYIWVTINNENCFSHMWFIYLISSRFRSYAQGLQSTRNIQSFLF